MVGGASILAAVCAGVSLTVGFTGLGLWIGYQLGKAAAPPANQALYAKVEQLYQDLAFCLKLSDIAAAQADQLSAWALQSAQMPQDMTTNMQQLMATTKSLSYRLQKAGNAARRKAILRPEEPECKNDSRRSEPQFRAGTSDLSAKELGRFTKTEQRRVEADGDSDRRRFAYDCQQRLLVWDDPSGPLPSAADTIVVRCHDLSMHGISFFWPDEPDFKHLLISLGSGDDLLFMAAEVVHSKPVFMHGEWQCVVSCRFIRRIREFSEAWQRQVVRPDEGLLTSSC